MKANETYLYVRESLMRAIDLLAVNNILNCFTSVGKRAKQLIMGLR